MDSSTCPDLPVSSGVKMPRSPSAREINCAPIVPLPFYPFMDDTYLDSFLNELHRENIVRLNSLRKSINKHRKKTTQRIDVLDRFVHFIESIQRTKLQLMHISVMKHKTLHKRRGVKLPLPRNIRQIMEEDSQNNLCQAVQGMHLNSESSVRKHERMLPSKVESPSEVAEDLSKLCMKD